MGRWRGFLDSIATTGGHIFVLIYMVMFGSVLAILGEIHAWMGIAKIGESVATGAFGALLMMYKPSGTNSEQIARAGAPYQPPQPPTASLHPPVVVADPPLPASHEGDHQ